MQVPILLTLFCSVLCLPSVRSHTGEKHHASLILSRRYQNDEIGTSVIPYKSPLTIPSSALSLRSQASSNKTRIIYKDASFLITSQQHTDLLAKMYAEIYDALANAAAAAELVAPIVVTYGGFVLTIVFFDKRYLIRTFHQLITDLMLVTMPILYTAIIVGIGIPLYWLEMRRQGLNEWHAW